MIKYRSKMIMVAILAVAGVLLSACVTVPTTGPVKAGNQEPLRPVEPVFKVAPAAPLPGASKKVVVEGFLKAMANYQPGYNVARQYITEAKRESWDPVNGTLIYSEGSPIADGDQIILDVPIIGSLSTEGAFSHRDQPLRHDFGVVKDASGEWRIDNPPSALIISEYAFEESYESHNVYFYEPQFRNLVPDPIYLPKSSTIEATLMQALLRGPTSWLRPAVRSAIPAKTRLNSGVNVDADGIAEVTLTNAIAALPDNERALMAAQVARTLSELPGIKGVRFRVEGERYVIPGEISDGGYVPVNFRAELGPFLLRNSRNPFGVTDEGVVAIDDVDDPAKATLVDGPLGEGAWPINSFATTADTRTIAAVTDQRSRLRAGLLSEGELDTLVKDATRLQRPQFSRYGELWTTGYQGGQQVLWVFVDGKPVSVDAQAVLGRQITDFRISPDGSRLAFIREVGNGAQLGLARIIRGDGQITVDGLRIVDLSGNGALGLTRIKDLGWTDSTNLLLLGASGAQTAYEPIEIRQDGSSFEVQGRSDNWDAGSLAVSPNPQGGFKAVVLSEDGRSWRSGDDLRWLPFLDKVVLRALVYPG